MLRFLFDEPKRKDSGKLRETMQTIEGYVEQLGPVSRTDTERSGHARQLTLRAKSFLVSLDELEQSVYCAGKFAERVKHDFKEQMDENERDDYYRHVYFYKNAFIRVYATLDKLGTFLDDVLDLGTEQVKPRYSYYTVLRRMQENKAMPKLTEALEHLKEHYREPVERLREQRNMEIHSINSEMVDDWQRTVNSHDTWLHIENIRQNMDDLRKGLEMVCDVLTVVFCRVEPRV